MPGDQYKNEERAQGTYVIDAESATESVRLMLQDRMMTKAMKGLFPQKIDLASVNDVLDVACGPGGWVIDVAYAHPEKQVTGIDISKTTIEYARTQAKVQWLDNVTFEVMDVLKPLNFPNDSFDVVNARFLVGFVPKASWPLLLQECKRVLRPGGTLCWTESEWAGSNSLAFEKMSGLFTRAFQAAGRSFSPSGERMGILPMMRRLVSDAGYQEVQEIPHSLNYSAGTEANASTYQDMMVGFKLIEPFLVKAQVITQEEVEALYAQMLAEMLSDDFCGLGFLLTVCGTNNQE